MISTVDVQHEPSLAVPERPLRKKRVEKLGAEASRPRRRPPWPAPLQVAAAIAALLAGAGRPLAAPGPARADAGSAMPALPPSCQAVFSSTLSSSHGFLRTGEDGHFHWQDGTRARFWGINVSSTRIEIPAAQIEATADTFARAGLNLVRLEAIDNRNCLLGPETAPDSQHFDLHYLDCLDHWMDALRRRGICYYLDLLDFRTFKQGDGVPNADKLRRGARPYAFFDPRLIQLQKEYADRLLTHRNPYSGIRPVDDPDLAMVEICNESGFFLCPDRLQSMVEPYGSELQTLWCQWLIRRYGTRARLQSAWGTERGVHVLRPDEDPAANTVDLPVLTSGPGTLPANEVDVLRARARQTDGVQFLAGLQRAYFHTMYSYLRSLGLKIPITGVVSNTIVPDVESAASECDFTAENFYGEGQYSDSRTPGLTYYSNRQPLMDDGPGGFAPYTGSLRWEHKPVVLREWDTTWPNQWRAGSVPQALAYASLQDFDAVLLFGYQTNQAPDGASAQALNDFAVQSDPTTWGLYALAGQAFLTGAIAPARHTVTLCYPGHSLFRWPDDTTQLARAAWSVRLESSCAPPSGKLQVEPTGDPARDLAKLKRLFDRLNRLGAPFDASSIGHGVWHSDTGQVSLYADEGRLEVAAPRLAMIAGDLKPRRVYAVGPIRLMTPTPFGALLVYSLDGKPLTRSGELAVKMVSVADNTGQRLEKAPSGSVSSYVLRASGGPPVVTLGEPSQQPTSVWLVKGSGRHKQVRSLVKIWMKNGTWEEEVRGDGATLACDTGGIRARLLSQELTTQEQSVASTGAENAGRERVR